MLEKWKQWALKMDLKKAVFVFLITGLAVAVGSSVALYRNFQGRAAEWEQSAETDRERGREGKGDDEERRSDDGEREHDGDHKEGEEKDPEDLLKSLHLSAGDVALMAGCGIIGMALLLWYWALVLIWVYRKSYRMDVNTAFWTLAALLFNLAAAAVLYLYALLRGTCTVCGRVKSGNRRFCDRCGAPLEKECPQCKQVTDISAAYCSNCGKKLNEG